MVLSEGKLRVERRASRVKKRAYELDVKKLDVRNLDLDLCSIFLSSIFCVSMLFLALKSAS
jgi:hypothetical protein